MHAKWGARQAYIAILQAATLGRSNVNGLDRTMRVYFARFRWGARSFPKDGSRVASTAQSPGGVLHQQSHHHMSSAGNIRHWPARGPKRRADKCLPAGILPEHDLADSLTRFERLSSQDLSEVVQTLKPVCQSAIYWGERHGKIGRLRAAARLLHRAGDDLGAISLLERAKSISPHDQNVATFMSEIYSGREDWWHALQAVAALATLPTANGRTLLATAQLYWQVGDIERSLQLYERAARLDVRYRTEYVKILAKSGRRDSLLAEADRVLAESPDHLPLCFAAFSVLLKIDANERAANARTLVIEKSENHPDGAIWRARLLKLEGDVTAGLALLTKLSPTTNTQKVTFERAKFALARGTWGLDAKLLLAARDVASTDSLLKQQIDLADQFLKKCGSSLNEAAKNPTAFADIKSPERVLEVLIDGIPIIRERRGTGLVSITPSLACGGAERVVAHSIRSFTQDPRFDWARLYALDVSSETNRDFYLKHSGLLRSDVRLIRPAETLELPWAWLGTTLGSRAQALFELLLKDKPGIVHSSLDFMNIPAGLAALAAGVPRVVLHVHNMAPRKTDKANPIRHLYRTLLQRSEVSLVACGQTCLDDYADWLGQVDTSRFHIVRNGAEVKRIATASSTPARQARRNLLGLGPDESVIGTAIRFVDLKQPLLWIEAAAKVLSRLPRCKFIMLGDGELHGAAQDYIRSMNLTEFFILPGLVNDVYEYLAAMDMFVLSSRSEALPNSLIEAQAAGVPVVAFDVGGVRETMIDGVTGHLVPEQSADALAERITAAIQDQSWCSAAADAARAFVETNFSNKRMVELLSGILLGGSPGECDARSGATGDGKKSKRWHGGANRYAA